MMQYLCCFSSTPHIISFTAVFRGQSRPGVHGCHPRRLPVGLSVSTNHEAASGGLEVKILLAGKKNKIKKNVLKSFVANRFETQSNESARRVAPDHHSVEQREAATQPEQMAPDARPPHRDGRQEEGERPPLLRALSDSMTKCCSGSLSVPSRPRRPRRPRGSLSLILLHHLYLRLFSPRTSDIPDDPCSVLLP